jgi:molybdopterin synthase sulfur carrier subunit
MGVGAAKVTVLLPQALRHDFGLKGPVAVSGATLGEALQDLDRRAAGLAASLLDDQGKVRRNVILFVNREAVTHLNPDEVPLKAGDTVHVLPHVAGG